MTESENKKSFPWVIVVGLPFLLLFLYVGAIGPITWMFSHGYISSQMAETLELVYSPLRTVYDNVDFVRTILDWYMSLFGR